MSEPLFSASWYRVADLRPRLALQLAVVRQPVRDQVWHVLSESASGRQLRLNPSAWEFAGRLDGTHTVEGLWQLLLARMGNSAPSQDDILRLLTQLYRAGMVQFDAAPHLSMLFAQREQDRRSSARAWINPVALRMRLLDPTRLLDRMAPLGRALFSPAAGIAWLLAVALAALACIVNFPALKAEAQAHSLSQRLLWMAWLCYPLIKTVHEFGHALAVRRFGGAVHEMGITLLFFTPAPYVDASAANGFERRSARVLVSAAGIGVELALAAVAAAVWFAVQPGLVRDLAFTVLLICSVSTILFNGNPLMRLDGYHVLADALNLPNLAARSSAWWASSAMRLLHGHNAPPPVQLAAGERKWLIGYAPLAWGYRIALVAALVGWLGGRSWLLGWLVAAAFTLWLGWQAGVWLLRVAGAGPARRRAAGALVLMAGLVVVLLLAVPAPAVVVARGVVWPPEGAQLRPEVAGFVRGTSAADGAMVVAGDVLLTLDDPALVAERERRASELAGLQARQYQALLREPARAVSLAEDIARNEAELARADEQLARLSVRGGADGRLVLPRPGDLPGSYAARGVMVGYILGDTPAHVRAVLDEQDVLRVRNRIRGVQVRLADASGGAAGWALPATLVREVPGGVRALPSAALGDRRGGAIAVDPADKDGLRTLAPVFLLDVTLPQQPAGRIGARAWVRFDLGYEPLGWQWARRLRQLLLRQFNPVGQA